MFHFLNDLLAAVKKCVKLNCGEQEVLGKKLAKPGIRASRSSLIKLLKTVLKSRTLISVEPLESGNPVKSP